MLRWSLASKVRGYSSITDAQVLDFTRRNGIISKNTSLFYPSLSQLAAATTSVAEFKHKYAHLQQDDPNSIETLRARINSIRVAGKNMCFLDVTHGKSPMQLILNYSVMKTHAPDVSLPTKDQFFQHIQNLKPGDHIQVCGFPGFSQREHTFSLKCTQLTTILAPAMHALPPKLSDTTKRNQNRVLDYLVNGHDSLIIRHKVISAIREFLNMRAFIEVETPILSPKANGAAAEPFSTYAQATDTSLELRVAPELWLKRLIIGGMDRVYEVGKVFRNEGVDATHNAEFTTLEFYQSYASMEALIELSEKLYIHVLDRVDTPRAKELKEALLENGGKFNRIEFLPTLVKEASLDLSNIDLNSSEHIRKAMASKGINMEVDGKSPQQTMNMLCAAFIEEKYCMGIVPTLIYHHPAAMSPLAKGNPMDNALTAKRFEVFIGGKEYINAYEEENCPESQLQKFELQQGAHDKYGDKESLAIDHSYIEAMKWGMPPIGGFGLGIDRLCMLLTENTRIERVLSFGTIDDIGRQ
ncbi:LANO_0H08042g1_1 [Lachancea nothofagi CBS 11611]|uniref:Lysine--tRNA ligase n=1 Tax=Lachancea nothofagi CBS 11611 TaxID=1266666 RepID=A0A1G4KLK8_9SACH|nr:LANO_0H08042g1_1 [Lachancea nothofagi CBS 11611]